MSRESPFGEWRNPAAILAISSGNYRRAIELWKGLMQSNESGQLPPMFNSLPFVALNPFWLPDAYPSSEIATTATLFQGVKFEGSMLWYHIAQAQMELGANIEAAESIRNALRLNPASPIRPLLRFYLENLTGEQIELKLPVPEFEEFADLSEEETKTDDTPQEKEQQPDKPADPK
jgi:hypothetical protein